MFVILLICSLHSHAVSKHLTTLSVNIIAYLVCCEYYAPRAPDDFSSYIDCLLSAVVLSNLLPIDHRNLYSYVASLLVRAKSSMGLRFIQLCRNKTVIRLSIGLWYICIVRVSVRQLHSPPQSRALSKSVVVTLSVW